ncbi:MAG: hypothetical protein LBR00_04870, partial [Clostridiales Family XIII bacterium]|nr:hypothetical protein [Clostridiales Family XIII bacterium]
MLGIALALCVVAGGALSGAYAEDVADPSSLDSIMQTADGAAPQQELEGEGVGLAAEEAPVADAEPAGEEAPVADAEPASEEAPVAGAGPVSEETPEAEAEDAAKSASSLAAASVAPASILPLADSPSAMNAGDVVTYVGTSAYDTIVIGANITLTAPLSVNRDLTFKADAGGPYTLTCAAGLRHIVVAGASMAPSWSDINLTFVGVILDGGNNGGGIVYFEPAGSANATGKTQVPYSTFTLSVV